MNISPVTTQPYEGLRPTWLVPNSNDPVSALWVIIAAAAVSYVSARILRSRHAWVHCLINVSMLCRSQLRSSWPGHHPWLHSPVFVSGAVLCIILYAMIQAQQPPPKPTIDSNSSQHLQPLLMPCRTTHRRFFPSKHSFNYSYLFVGVPAHWRGTAGQMLSTPNSPSSPNAWFSVQPEDYLQRGTHPAGLQGKLKDYLTSQGIDPSLYPTAYLVTAPCFLGFSFNPVSFWYLYDQSGTLSAMILEVNNTFDERRMYFLRRDDQPEPSTHAPAHNEASNNTNTVNNKIPVVRFTQSWQKDFHVSPFNDRLGTYSLLAKDIQHDSTIDNTITLSSPDGKPKLVARIYSSSPTITPDSMTTLQKILFMLKWCMTGFLTNPRILREAWTLWWKNVKVFYRPEVLVSSIGRTATREEVCVERGFRDILERVADGAGVEVIYEGGAGEECGRVVVLGEAGSGSRKRVDSGYEGEDVRGRERGGVKIRVLTPAFYSELARSVRVGLSLVDVLVFWSKGVAEDARLLSIETTAEDTLNRLFENANAETHRDRTIAGRKSRKVSRRAATINVLTWFLTGDSGGANKSDREACFLDLVRQYSGDKELEEVLWSTARIWLADCVALGLTRLLTVYASVLRYWCVGLFTRYVVRWAVGI